MNNIDFDRFYNDFDLGDFLTEPIGRFNRTDMRDILNTSIKPEGVVLMSDFNGIRQTMSQELKGVRNDPEWQKKVRYIGSTEAQEIYNRILLKESIKKYLKED